MEQLSRPHLLFLPPTVTLIALTSEMLRWSRVMKFLSRVSIHRM